MIVKHPFYEHIVGVACQFKCPDELAKQTWQGKPMYPEWITVSLMAPYRHGHILHPTHVMADKHCLIKQGFLTSKGRFVERSEAWEIANTQGQIIPHASSVPGTLYSEDLW
jgi:hypothetical protein